MFKKFNPKEDVSGSTSLKSSVQRNIRNQLLAQLPLLSAPAFKEGGAVSAPAPAAAPVEEAPPAPASTQDEDEGKGKGGKKGGGGKTKGGGKKGGKKQQAQAAADEDEHDDEGDVTVLDEIWPKKDSIGLTKCHDRISIYTLNQIPIFMNHYDGPFMPTLRLLHKYPAMLPKVQIDRGAIKFMLAGANMMAPGLLSAGGILPDGLDKDALVAIHAEGKEHATGIGRMAASSAEIKKAGKGVAVEVVCWVGDDFWKVQTLGL